MRYGWNAISLNLSKLSLGIYTHVLRKRSAEDFRPVGDDSLWSQVGSPFFVSSLPLKEANQLDTAQLTFTSEKRRESKGEPKQDDVIHE